MQDINGQELKIGSRILYMRRDEYENDTNDYGGELPPIYQHEGTVVNIVDDNEIQLLLDDGMRVRTCSLALEYGGASTLIVIPPMGYSL